MGYTGGLTEDFTILKIAVQSISEVRGEKL